MKIKKCITVTLIYFTMVGSVKAQPSPTINVSFNVYNDDPSELRVSFPRTPVRVPNATLEGHILSIDSCDGCEVQLLQNDETIYTTTVISGKVELPKQFRGIFILQVIRGSYCFWAEIEL